MTVFNLGTARGSIEIDTNSLKNADIALRSAGRGLLGFGAAAGAAFGYIIKVGADFEKEMSFVQAVTNASADQMDSLKKSAIELGKQGPFGPREVAKGFVDLAKAGLSAQEIIGGVGEAAVDLAAAGDISFTDAAEVLVNVMRSFNLTAADSVDIVNSVAGAANASTVDIDDMAYSLRYAAAPAASLGISVDDLNAALAILGNRGIRGSTAGTALRRVFLNLAAPTSAATDAMKKLGIVTADGVNLMFDSAGKLKSLPEIFQILQEKMAGLTQQQKVAALNAIFGARAVNSALILSEQGAQGFDEILQQINSTTASEVAAKRMDNLAGAVTRFKAALEAVFIDAGSPFQKFLKNIVDGLREIVLWFGSLPKGLQTFILSALAGVAVLSILAGGFLLTVGNIVRAIRVFGELGHAMGVIKPVISGLVSGFRALGAAMAANPYVLIVLAIVAIGVALFELYKHSEGFRKFIDGLWQSIQKGWDKVLAVLKTVGEAIGGVFLKVQNVVTGVFDWIGDRIRGVVEGVQAFFRAFTSGGIASAGNTIVGVFERIGAAARGVYLFFRNFGDSLKTIGNGLARFGKFLGGAIVDGLSAAGKAIMGFVKRLPKLVGYAIGFVIGQFIRLSYEVPKWIVTMGIKVLKQVAIWGVQLATLFAKFIKWAVDGAVTILLKLPGQVWDILTSILTQLALWGVQLLEFIWTTFIQVVQTIVNILINLPSIIWNLFLEVVSTLTNIVPKIWQAAWDIGKAIFQGIWDFIWNMPEKVWDILTGVVNRIKDIVGDVWDAARDFGAGIWNGFKRGLGINSPSYVEEAMFAIQGESANTVSILRREVAKMQHLSSGIPKLASGALGLPTPANAALTANGGGTSFTNTGPLIGQAVIRSDQDITKLARELAQEQIRVARSRGRKS